ncbi:MAG: hypothetical protein ACXQS4_02520 [Methermicoccaceae archaeon]
MNEELERALDELKRSNRLVSEQIEAFERAHRIERNTLKGQPNLHMLTCPVCGGRIEAWRNGATKEGERPPTIRCARCTQKYKLVKVGKKVEIHSGIREDV